MAKASVNVDTRTNNRINKIADERKAILEQIEELKAAAAVLDEKLKAAVVKNGENIKTDRWSVCYSTTLRGGFDSAKFKIDHPKMFEEYQKEKVEVESYRVTPR